MKHDMSRRFKEIDLYPVTAEDLSEGRSNLEVLQGLIDGGARIVQLRDKQRSKREIYHLAVEFRRRTLAAGMLLIINDYLDIAMAVGADGVHLGCDDLPIDVARSLAPEMIIGASSHDLEEALAAQAAGATYVNIGPIFPTLTKENVPRFLGPEAITEMAPHLHVPFTVMGGINAANLQEVLSRGARYPAMVTAVTRAPDIAAQVRALRVQIRAAR